MRRSLIPVLLATTATSGCLPTRENPSDPYNKPDVTVRIHDFTLAGSNECGDPTAQAWPEVTAVSRGRCLYAEATETTDPQGDDLDELDFTFYVDTGNGPTRATATTGAIFVLDSALREDLPAEIPLSVIAQAKDTDGARGRGRATLILLNRRPLAFPGPGFQIPAGGYPWQGGSLTVTFDGSESDARDLEEHAQECWLFPDEASEICAESSPEFTREIALAGLTRYAARLRIDDGKFSTPAWTEISAAGRPLWTLNPSVRDARVFDPPVPVTPADNAFLVSTSPTAKAIVVGISDAAMLVPYPVPSPIPNAVLTVSAGQVINAAGGGDGTIYILTKEFTVEEVDFVVSRFNASSSEPSGLLPVGVATPLDSADDGCQEGLEPALAVDATGTLWVASRLFGDLRTVAPDGSLTVITEGTGNTTPGVCSPGEFDDFAYAGATIRPGTNEAWFGVVPYTGGVAVGPRLEVFTSPSQSAPTRTVALPWTPSDIAWASTDELWITSTLGGLVRVDVALLESGFPLEESIVASYPELTGFTRLIADPVTGTVWIRATNGAETARIYLDGTVVYGVGSGNIFFVGHDGRGWDTTGSGGDLRIRTGPSEAVGVSAGLPLPDYRAIAVDPSRGWLWAGVALGIQNDAPPWGIAAAAPNGRIARLSDRLIGMDGNVRGVPTVDLIRVTPDGNSMFLVTGNEDDDVYRAVLRIDLTTPIPTVVSESTDQNLVNVFIGVSGMTSVVGSKMLGPTSPSGDAIWTHDVTTGSVYQIDGTTFAPVGTPYSVPLADRSASGVYYGPYAAVLPVSNRLCMLTRSDAFTGTYRARYVSDDGAAPQYTSATYVEGAGPGFVATWADASGAEGCWVAMMTDNTPPTYVITSLNAAGGIIGTRTFTDGFPRGIAPISGTEAWIDWTDVFPQPWRRRVTFPADDFTLYSLDDSATVNPFEAATASY